MRLAPIFALMVLVGLPGLADTSYSCIATHRDADGVETPIPCLEHGIRQARLSLDDVSMINYLFGNTLYYPDGTVEVVNRQTASATATFVITGGVGAGLLSGMFFSDYQGYDLLPGSITHISYQSNFLPGPVRLTSQIVSVPFTFGVPLTLWFNSELEVDGTSIRNNGALAWEIIQSWEGRFDRILDSDGNAVSDAVIQTVSSQDVAVPEPASVLLTLMIAAITLRRAARS